MIAAFHRIRRDEEGQALVLGAVLLLVIALGVLGTLRLGGRIHDRVQLQNAADGAAYGLAVQEARAFNFYAWSNRAQISQYVTVLQLLSLDAMMLGLLNGMGTFAAILKTAGELCDGPKKAGCIAIPGIGEALVVVSQIAAVAERLVLAAARAISVFDRFVGEVGVPLLVGSNLFLHANQRAMQIEMAARLSGDEALRLARATSPDAEFLGGTAGGMAMRTANLLRFSKAHLAEAMELGRQTDRPDATLADGAAGRRNWARRGLGELIHATRSDFWVYDRRFPAALRTLFSGVQGIDGVVDVLEWLPGASLRGHTRLLSEANPTPSQSEAIYRRMERPGYGTARYPTGNAIGANFYFVTPGGKDGPLASIGRALGMNREHQASVTSSPRSGTGGWSCTWDVRNPYERKGIPGLAEIFTPRFSCDVNRGRHPWFGLTPYMAFAATGDGCTSFASEHCQPDVLVGLRLPPKRERVIRIPGIRADSDPKDEGPTAVARAIAYYHRPGNWQEPPNFFNPFWRARLAPVQTGVERLAEGAGWLGGVPDRLVGKVLVH